MVHWLIDAQKQNLPQIQFHTVASQVGQPACYCQKISGGCAHFSISPSHTFPQT